jgi:hypothetical protein
MALCFVTQIVENNYSVVDSNVKLRSNNCIIFQPSTRSRDCGERVHLQGASPLQGRRNSMVKGQVPSLVDEVEKRGR